MKKDIILEWLSIIVACWLGEHKMEQIKNSLDIKSPSREYIKWMDLFLVNFEKGIKEGLKERKKKNEKR